MQCRATFTNHEINWRTAYLKPLLYTKKTVGYKAANKTLHFTPCLAPLVLRPGTVI